tara:strand:+ start:679 stop:1035 length:357 start_codon:yes stop_codon:yes gene_type:complete
MKISKRRLRKIIIQEKRKINEEIERVSELNEFVGSKSGKLLMQEGARVASAGRKMSELALNHTGAMRRGIAEIGSFVEGLGTALAELNSVSEGSSATDNLPTLAEFKKMIKEIQKLEK